MNKNELKKYTIDFMNNETGSNRSNINSVMGKMLIKYAEIFQKQIKDLEQKLEQTEKDLADYQFNYSTIKELEKENAELQHKIDTLQGFLDHDIEYNMDKTIQEQKIKIEELKFQIEKIKQDLDNARENANEQEQWEIYSVLNDIYNDNFVIITGISN